MTNQFIYGIFCPTSLNLKYVGRTCNLKNRFNTHKSDSLKKGPKNLFHSWFYSCLNKNQMPIMKTIEVCSDFTVNNREIWWINFFTKKGIKLKNMLPGGEGRPKGCIIPNRYTPPKGILPEHFKKYIGNRKGAVISKEQLEKFKKTVKGMKKPKLNKPIVCKDIINNIEMCFKSRRDACLHFNIKVAMMTYYLTSGKPLLNKYVFANMNDEYKKPKSLGVRVKAYKEEEHLITFFSIRDASLFLNKHRNVIYSALNKPKIINGYKLLI